MQLRPYQQAAVDALFDYWANPGSGNAVIELATGLGKSIVLAEIVRRITVDYPAMRSMMLSHVKEIIEQNYRALHRLWPEAPAGIYNAALNRRETRHRVIYGSIQSCARKPEAFIPRNLLVVDECHLVSPKQQTQYHDFIKYLRQNYPALKLVGLTATPYRMDTGQLVGEGQMFDDIVYKYNVGDGIADGWLTPITSQASPRVSINTDAISVRGGEFVERELIEAAGDPAMILAACTDMLRRVSDRRGILVFCTGVAHAGAVAECLRVLGETAEVITGDTASAKRTRVIDDFKSGKIRFLTNANVLTTGFDAPELSCIALMRPTLSTALYVQMVGRGTRITEEIDVNLATSAEGRREMIRQSSKPNCLVLDYAGNLERHGPLNLVSGKVAKVDKDAEADGLKDCHNPECGLVTEVGAWVNNDNRCPECNTQKCPTCELYTDYDLWDGQHFSVCPSCGADKRVTDAEAQRVAEHEVEAKAGELIADLARVKGWRSVLSWEAGRHSKKMFDPDAIDTIKVTYFCEHGHRFSEWLCFDHPQDNFAYKRAARWWKEHGGTEPAPATTEEALQRWPAEGFLKEESQDDLNMPFWIVVEKDGKWDRVTDRSFVEQLDEKRVEGVLW